jgi:cytochrome c oxidase subunit 2
LRIPALGRRTGRLAKLAMVPAVAFLIAACTDAANTNPTGDDAAPGLFTGEVVTTEGLLSASLYMPIFLVATVVFFLIEGLLLFMAWRFRARGRAKDDLPKQTHGNNMLELVWTIIPAIIVTVMFIGSAVVLADVQETSDDPDVVVDVEAFRFGWKFDYDEYGISIAGGGHEGAPEMVLPIDRSVQFRLTAADVIHSFYVPSFFYKMDAVPGRTNIFELTIEKAGVYGGQCAEFCGLAHGDMFFSVRAVEPAEFDDWVAEQSGGVAAGIAGETS